MSLGAGLERLKTYSIPVALYFVPLFKREPSLPASAAMSASCFHVSPLFQTPIPQEP